MNCLIQRVHALVKQKVQKLDSNSRADLAPAHIDEFINISVNNFIDACFTEKQFNKGLGFEGSRLSLDMISNLIVKESEQPSLIPMVKDNGIYEIPYRYLKYPLRHVVRMTINTDCGPIDINLEKHFSLNTILNDEFSKPSRKWKRIPHTIGKSSDSEGSSFYLYTNKDFTISNVDIEYIKQPERAYIGGYNSLESIYTDGGYSIGDDAVNPEIDSNYIDVLVNLVVTEWEAMVLQDYNVAKDKLASNY